MELLTKNSNFPKNVSVILGFFDGVHLGHRRVVETALQTGKKTVILTFPTSPSEYFNKTASYVLQRNLSYGKLDNLGVDYLLETEFAELAAVLAEDYLENYIIKRFQPYSISTGFNHTFGLNRAGNADFLEQNQQKYNYKYFCAPPCRVDNQVVSSTYIKELLKSGNLTKANQLLGTPFIIKSTVIEGQKLGRTIGFPTANLTYPEKIVKIPYGVYFVSANGHKAVLNWGVKPTIGGNKESLEVHIIDYNENLYGKTLRVEFIQKLRDEKRFTSLEELKQQIEKDIEECLKL